MGLRTTLPIEKKEAVSALLELYPVDRLLVGEESLKNYSSSVSGDVRPPLCVVKPLETSEVIATVKLANSHGFSIFAISRGRNYGYGDRLGTKIGQIIIDFSSMNKVLEVDETLCTVSFEPGVSQEGLHQALKKTRLQCDVTGAGKQASVMGNILERGFGHSEYGNRFERIISMSVVLPNGELLKTGFADVKNAKAQKSFRYAPGPAIDGLFTQSNLGIITEITIEVQPKPEKSCQLIFSTNNKDDIGSIISTVRELRLKGVLSSSVHIANQARSMGKKKSKVIGQWALSASISGEKEILTAKKKLAKKAFKKSVPRARCIVIGDLKLRILRSIDKYFTSLPFVTTLQYANDLLNGIPTDEPIRTLFDGEKLEKTNELTAENIPEYFRWISATVPAKEEDVKELISTLENIFNSYDLIFKLTLTSISPRTFIAISEVAYNKDMESVELAHDFYKKCTDQLAEKGFYPYRGGSGNPTNTNHSKTHKNLLEQIKNSLDPEKVLAPGKYHI